MRDDIASEAIGGDSESLAACEGGGEVGRRVGDRASPPDGRVDKGVVSGISGDKSEFWGSWRRRCGHTVVEGCNDNSG